MNCDPQTRCLLGSAAAEHKLQVVYGVDESKFLACSVEG